MIPESAVTNESGMVAMKYRKLFPLRVRCGGWPNYMTYAFTIKANIAMTWVEPEHVDCMLQVKYGCCGKKKPGGVIFASEDDVRRWTNGGGR